jgi:hypothetical protein
VGCILNLSLQIAANLAIAFEPFLPFTADKLRNMLAMEGCSWESLGRTDLLRVGHQLNPAELLFEKIEDEAIEQQIKNYSTPKTTIITQANKRKSGLLPRPKPLSITTVSAKWTYVLAPYCRPKPFPKRKN